MIFRWLIAIISLLAVSCETTQGGGNGATEEVSIAHLKSLCQGSHHRITSDLKISGTVVVTDWKGEFYKSIVIVDETAGIEVAIDSYNIHDILPVYSQVEIFCNGLMLARAGGKIEIGAPSTGDFPLDNIDADKIGRYIRIVGIDENFSAPTKRFQDIGIADISNVVRFDNVEICAEEQGLAWCDKIDGEVATTFRTIVDEVGNTFYIRTLSSCHYALDDMPTKKFSVVGVIDYADDRYFLRIINGAII